MNHTHGFKTRCVHTGNIEDNLYHGAVSPIFLSSAYGFLDQEVGRYPRYFTTPNQVGLAQKIASLENAQAGLILGSGMAAITAVLFSHLKSGDHLLVQQDLYGGSTNLIREEFSKYQMDYTFVSSFDIEDFKKAIKTNTKGIFIETPSNPLLKIMDIESIARVAKEHGLWTLIDNTFASPVNQNPIDFGIDMVMHSATKYLGGHSDICAGVLLSSHKTISKIRDFAKNLGASLSDNTAWLLERSIKTLFIRVKEQTKNAHQLAAFLEPMKSIKKVYYPGLKTHPGHQLASKQMKDYGAMLSCVLDDHIDLISFFKSLKIFKPVISLGGVESGVSSPKMTSHILLTDQERRQQGIEDQLVRFSLGIENIEDLKSDIQQAIHHSRL
ncbi:MAG: PLP-dependent aspartate aminotransferase family protein [Flavobacteriaceae bacterium]|nr:PLP-dependent aspartate aminotransferase family protein [Flavobacteriaceae bacterium]MCY4217638.1 PLP-dependent aspartate aminotransferase family protein [Flavobacteriaceae bacterium]MCY4253917.1 PLP-dependent aspartate aminotransferase family protein [Flavobacteriaceae bacterium]